MKPSSYASASIAVPVEGVVAYAVADVDESADVVVHDVHGQLVYAEAQSNAIVVPQQSPMYGSSVLRQPLPSAPIAPPEPPAVKSLDSVEPLEVEPPVRDEPKVTPWGLASISLPMRRANLWATRIAVVVFVLASVVVPEPSWGSCASYGLKLSQSGDGTICDLDVQADIGLFTRAYYSNYGCYKPVAGNPNANDHLISITQDGSGLKMDCDFLRESIDSPDAADVACADLHSAQTAASIVLAVASLNLFMLWLRCCSYSNVSLITMIAVPLLCVVQLICAFIAVVTFRRVNDAIDRMVVEFEGVVYTPEVTMEHGGGWETMWAVGFMTFFELCFAVAMMLFWRSDPDPPNEHDSLPCKHWSICPECIPQQRYFCRDGVYCGFRLFVWCGTVLDLLLCCCERERDDSTPRRRAPPAPDPAPASAPRPGRLEYL